MKKALVALAIATVSGAVFAQDPSATPPNTPEAANAMATVVGPDLAAAAEGEMVYQRFCAACHGLSLKGDGPVASGLVKKPIDLTTLLAKSKGTFPFDKVAAMIDGRETNRMHGSPDMPVWGEVFAVSSGTPDAAVTVKRVTHYVWSKQAKTGGPAAGK